MPSQRSLRGRMHFNHLQGWAAAVVLIPAALAQPRLDSTVSIHGNGYDQVSAMAVDGQGNTYLTGTTTSSDLGTRGAFQSQRASSNLYAYDRSRDIATSGTAEMF